MSHRVNVRTLAEFYCEGGDLFAALNAVERMREGMQAHVLLQKQYPKSFRHEVPISLEAEVHGFLLTLYGRMDGLDEEASPPLVEEIKTTRRTPSDIRQDDYPVHWVQAELYAFMLARQRQLDGVDVRIVYTNLVGDRVSFTRRRTRAYLEEMFLRTALPYVQWLRLLDAQRDLEVPTFRALDFPYSEYRQGQRDMAVQCYIAFKNRANLLCQAPTGIGKTMGALFPAIKALGEGLASRVFYLTARGTAAQAAEDALDRLRERGLVISSVRLTAKEKVCVMPGGRCDPMLCPRAIGYYDRRREALREAVSMGRLSREAIDLLAERHELCPFELSLDLSETCDVIICDYNYAFDPRVKLRRYFMEKTDSILLIDEAHNLIDRARGMLSAEIDLNTLRALKKELAALGDAAKKSAVYETLSLFADKLRRAGKALEQPACDLEPDFSVSDAALAFTEEAGKLLSEASVSELFREVYFMALDFARVADEYTDEHRALTEKTADKNVRMRLWCYDPSKYLAKCLSRVGGSVLFSATLSPMEYYARMLGVNPSEGDALLDLPSPFPQENLFVARLPISTRFSMREQSAASVAEAILAMAGARRGNYLACLPSYRYLEIVEREIRLRAGNLQILSQKPRMDDAAREMFLAEFAAKRQQGLLALVVMGGVFAEAIDLPGELLSGAAIVGVGIPQPTFEREVLRELTDDGDGCGAHFAYTYPGIERVLQAAGRVIRAEEDMGCVLLIDDRYCSEFYEALLPPHWNVSSAKTVSELKRMLARFWRHSSAL
ncbi:MAG: helicase C-terminal domain-containing protein [Christensenellales bacterium]